MPRLPSFIVDLYETNMRGRRYAGSFDLGVASSRALMRDEVWQGHKLPETAMCKSFGHSMRMALWEGRLVSPGLHDAFNQFAEAVALAGGADIVYHLHCCREEAQRRLERAIWLAETVREASVREHVAGKVAFDPYGQRLPVSGRWPAPFAFAERSVKFTGIGAEALADFLDLGDDIEKYLETVIQQPSVSFVQEETLHEIGRAYVADTNFERFADSLATWNARQDVRLSVADYSMILIQKGNSKRVATQWCAGHIESFRECISDINSGTNPFPVP